MDSGGPHTAQRELARIFDASVGTVRNALRNLVTQGYLSREQGRGTFVRKSIEHSDALRYFVLSAVLTIRYQH